MLSIRLTRMGAKKKPFYRIVVTEKRSKRDGRYLGYLNDPQGESFEDLKDHLKDLYHTFTSEQISGTRKVEDLEIA